MRNHLEPKLLNKYIFLLCQQKTQREGKYRRKKKAADREVVMLEGQPQVLHTCWCLWYTTCMPTPQHVQLPPHLPDCSPDSPGLHWGPAHGCEHQTEKKKKNCCSSFRNHYELLYQSVMYKYITCNNTHHM